MMQQHVLLAQHVKHFLILNQGRRQTRRERREFQFRALDQIVNANQAIEIHRAVHFV